jgi:hypothetical protein
MTDSDLQAIEARNAARTPGMLVAEKHSEHGWPTVRATHDTHAIATFMRLEDAAHFVFSGADVTALLAEVAFLRRVLCDMADDGKAALAHERCRRALEEIERRVYDDENASADAHILWEVATQALDLMGDRP